jgi:hypothetical protein
VLEIFPGKRCAIGAGEMLILAGPHFPSLETTPELSNLCPQIFFSSNGYLHMQQ